MLGAAALPFALLALPFQGLATPIPAPPPTAIGAAPAPADPAADPPAPAEPRASLATPAPASPEPAPPAPEGLAAGAPTATGSAGEVAEPSAVTLSASHVVRSGVVLGLDLGAGAVGASGYPNDLSRIGDPDFYSASGAMFGVSESVYVLGALSDYLNFGFWFTHGTASSRHWESRGDAGGLRVETFPLVSLVPSLGGLGLFAQFGVGSGRLTAKVPDLPDAEGTQSSIGAGVFQEWSFWHPLGGHLAAGPSVAFDAIWSRGFERHGVMAGARLVFYGGPRRP